MEEDQNEEIMSIFKQVENMHYPCGSNYAKNCKIQALLCQQENELEAIWHLTESHSSTLRFTSIHQFEKSMESKCTIHTLNKQYVNFECRTVYLENKIKTMLSHIQNMPKEWTIVQLTSQFNVKESMEINPQQFYTSPLHVTVFSCGDIEIIPFTITLDPPIDELSGKIMEIKQEMQSIISDNMKYLEHVNKFFNKDSKNVGELQAYTDIRYTLNSRLENLVKQIQNKWLKEWRCLLMGKFVDEELEKTITLKISSILEENKCILSPKKTNLLKYLVKGSNILSLIEIRRGVSFIFSEDQYKDIRIAVCKIINSLSKTHSFKEKLRHPIILIIDEKLDIIPWEMIDILIDHPVSRMPSLHFTYGLFKEHEENIVNGCKINIQSKNGTYLINPGLDLKRMEIRLNNFLSYWVPEWSGMVGVKPSEEEFKNMLLSGDIFVYSGHGNGTQFFPSEKISKLRINKVVFLFGCSSVTLSSFGVQVEMFGAYQTYLIACSPCVVGMLWQVTDVDTDLLTAELLSQWIPSTVATTHWKLIDKKQWQLNGGVNVNDQNITLKEIDKHEPELLRALCKAKKAARHYFTRAACIVRGLPVKIN